MQFTTSLCDTFKWQLAIEGNRATHFITTEKSESSLTKGVYKWAVSMIGNRSDTVQLSRKHYLTVGYEIMYLKP